MAPSLKLLICLLLVAFAPTTTADTPAPTTANTPAPTTANTPAPTTADTPAPTTADTPAPTTANTPAPTTANTPAPTTANTPAPTTADTPAPTTADTPAPTTADTPAPTTADTPAPTTANTPAPTTADTPAPTTADTPAPTTADTPAPTTADTPAPTTADTPAPTTADTPAPTTADTPAPTTADTPAPTTPGGSTTTSTVPQDPCDPNPCKDGSTCEERAEKFVCLCKTEAYYNNTEHKCISAKVFPGDIKTNIDYKKEMEDKTSKEFQNTETDIDTMLKDFYKGEPDKKYIGSVVLKLSEVPTKASKVEATVNIIFDTTSPITIEEVKENIVDADVGTLAVCPMKLCDEKTTVCSETDRSFSCNCTEKYVKSDFSDLLCVACPNGEKAVKGVCEKCKFGYTGFDCADNWQLILVIVGSVLGAFLVIAIIVLPVVVVNSKKKLKKAKTTDYEKSYSNSAPAKTPQVSNGLGGPKPAAPSSGLSGFMGNGVPRIPRAVTNNNSWDRNTNLEMVPSNSRQNLLPRNSRRFDDDEDSNPYSRPMKPQNNPYGGGRPQTNPYASNQGHSNPYYRH